jgi:hypothetical protein
VQIKRSSPETANLTCSTKLFLWQLWPILELLDEDGFVFLHHDPSLHCRGRESQGSHWMRAGAKSS